MNILLDGGLMKLLEKRDQICMDNDNQEEMAELNELIALRVHIKYKLNVIADEANQ